MAITIQQQPALWSPVYNPMMFILDSSNVAQSNFKYLVQVYVSGSTDTITLAIDPDPTYAQGQFDAHRILESFLSSDKGAKALNGFQIASNSMIAYEIKFGEQYGAASAVTNYPALKVTGTKYAFNGAYDVDDWLNFNGANIAVEDSKVTLTTQSNARTTYSDLLRDNYVHYITNTSGSVYYAEIKTFDSSGSLIQTALIENPYQAVSSYSHRRMIFYAGSRALNAASLFSGTQPLIDSSVYSYTVNFRAFNQVTTPLLTFITYTRDLSCFMGRTPITLHWKTYKGDIASYDFSMINRYKTETSKTSYQKNLGTMTNNAWSYAKSDAGKVNFDTRVQGRYELQSDWTSISDSEFLMGLIESPEVYFDDGTNFIRVNVVSPTTAELQSVSLGGVDLSNIKITVELSNENWRQRG